jgi:hypothetical protein
MTRSLTTALLLISIPASLASLLPACSSSTPGRGGLGTGSGAATANCALLQIENECICSTTNDLPVNNTACRGSTVSGVCCADLQWPASGLHCSCQIYQCIQTASGCRCGLGTTGPTQTCGPIAGGTCCQHVHSDCECGTSVSCDTAVGDVVVSQCGPAQASCLSSDQKVIDACQ